MAVLTAQQVTDVFSEGYADFVLLVACKNVTAGDTFDVGASGALPRMSQVKRAVGIGLTTAGAASLTVTGTVVTIPAGLANDAAYVLCYGCAL